jgi:hypothetical protein
MSYSFKKCRAAEIMMDPLLALTEGDPNYDEDDDGTEATTT